MQKCQNESDLQLMNIWVVSSFSAIMKNTAMNIFAHVSLGTCARTWELYLGVKCCLVECAHIQLGGYNNRLFPSSVI